MTSLWSCTPYPSGGTPPIHIPFLFEAAILSRMRSPMTSRSNCAKDKERSGSGGRVEVWRGGCRPSISVAAPFVWRCLTGSTLAPFPHLAHRTGHADLPHPALGQDVTPSPTTGPDQAVRGVRAGSTRKGARGDNSRPCVA